jgi:cell division protein FtsW
VTTSTRDGRPRGTGRDREERTPTVSRATAGGLRLRGPAWLDGPMTTSHLVLGSAGLLLLIGLVMVFSASSIEAAKAGQPAWLPGVRQIGFALVGVIGMLVALRLPIGRLRQCSGWAMLAAFFLLLLVLVPVPGVTLKLNGSRAWFNLGVTNFQPSELAKLVFALWGAHVIALREKYLTIRDLVVPVLPAFALMSLLLLAEPDMGAVVSLGLVVAGLMWAGGLSRRYIGAAVVVVVALIGLMIAVAPYRMARITSFLDPFADASNGGYQAVRGLYALATGGVWGVGLGNSAMKWNLLPHAESDYIFAIIGEELGFLGCLVVVSLYAVLAWAGFRIARRSADRFIQLASVAITVWLIGQATMNMGYVVGLLPVTGVQLPLISAGGTSLVLTLFIVGLLARFARAEPAAIAFQRAQPRGWLARLLLPVPSAAVEPVPTPARRRRAGGRSGDQRAAGPRPGGRAGGPDGRTLARGPVPPGSRSPAGSRETARGAGWGTARGAEARVPTDAGRRAQDRRPTPDERRRAAERQTVRGRPDAGDRPTVLRRPAAAARPVPRDVPREQPRSGEVPAPRVRPAPRSHPPRTERPGRPQ